MAGQALRLWVFIDAQNNYNDARRAFYKKSDPSHCGQVYPYKLAELLAQLGTANDGRDRAVDRVMIYKGMPSSKYEPRSFGAARRQKSYWIGAGVKVFDRPLRYPRNWPKERAEEKGIDVALAVDLVYYGIAKKEFDVAVVCSTDTDLLPALEKLCEQFQAWGTPRLEVASWIGPFPDSPPQRKRLSVPGFGFWCHWLDESHYQAVQDVTNYVTGP